MTPTLAAPGDVPTDKTQIKFYARRGDDLRDALKHAAADDQRSTSVMIERILIEWLEARGYLAKSGEAKPRRGARKDR